jgi:hypothetical protein
MSNSDYLTRIKEIKSAAECDQLVADGITKTCEPFTNIEIIKPSVIGLFLFIASILLALYIFCLYKHNLKKLFEWIK